MTTKEGADWHRTVTVRLHLTDDPATNARIVDTPGSREPSTTAPSSTSSRTVATSRSRRAPRGGITGLQERWLTWRKEELGLRDIRSKTARGAIAAAGDRVAKWEAVKERHAMAVARTDDNGEPIPRGIQRRRVDPWRLYRRRKLKVERRGRHLVRVDDGVHRIDRHTITLLPLESATEQ